VARSFFNISGMSYGALSHAAVSALSKGAKLAGVWMSTGRGVVQIPSGGGGDIIMQIGTAKYGVRDADGELSEARLREIAAYPQVKMFEVKLAQGAKPGKGGILPGEGDRGDRADPGYSRGQDSISPEPASRHWEYTELGEFIARVRESLASRWG
jgi:glutamate synthase domain-containing protein 2